MNDSSLASYRSPLDDFGPEELKKKIVYHLMIFLGRDPERVNYRDIYKAVAYTLRDIMVERWLQTQKGYYAMQKKRVYYLSMEFLIGRSLGNALMNLGLYDKYAEVLAELGFDLEKVREQEEDAALGNGGLGRLAACFLDSIATLGIPAYGYGIRYEYGLFYQKFEDGYQVERPDNWLRSGCPWEFERPEFLYRVNFYGRVQRYQDSHGRQRTEWVDTEHIMAMACDFLVPGFNNNHVINMRLWAAKSSRDFDLSYFNRGDYIAATKSKIDSETISKLLYPSDHRSEGRKLRLRQQYFFVAATFQDIFRRFKKKHTTFENFSNEIAVQLNDTHPSIAIPEMMRLLVDVEGCPWEMAWDQCVKTFGFTNHTLMPEALETWPVDVLGATLPRHLEIIYEINRRFLDEVSVRYPGNVDKLRKMSLIEEGDRKQVRMANLAVIGSHSVNGVAELHTHLLRTRIFKDFDEFFPGRFNNKTNGITHRRWLLKANPPLAKLITETIGSEWVLDLYHLRKLEAYAEKQDFQRKWRWAKKKNKQQLARWIKKVCDVDVDPQSLFDAQIKRIHEYKRQFLNILHVITMYHQIVAGNSKKMVPRTVIFAGKAAPAYEKAKLLVKLINSVAEVVNNDDRVEGRLRVVFVPNYGVSVAEKIIPATDLSEQISTAGTEASGTGNMKFALNGALTIGTLDGANIEISEEVGADNIFIFGMTAAQVEAELKSPSRTPQEICAKNPAIERTVESLRIGTFSRGQSGFYSSLVNDLMNPYNPYLVLQDLADYLRCQEDVSRAYLDQKTWTMKSILNVARMGKFSSDRTIRQYSEEIWGIKVERDNN